ncbi:hypothetical protein NUBL17186_38670 [Klebsiella quasipneumoniae]|nr:hypothetical protein TUM17554_14900 [Klebsiella pneumoniae]GKO90407.1 hypothetical protein NUBL17186_38670 [Klebsiella quasipneumoniae]GMA00130.1 hypothetical protein KML003_02530 [Klebsiella quasipneumoniae subsp. similipneumoniae]GKP20360.1 hypothetical protein NUKP16_24250 [Klebsiella quasipneumoniae]GKP49641.1 hypothetical protein NUKP43_25390 [Klebsiella quasipneumoniae]
MQKVAVEKRGMQLMRHFAGDSGFSAAGNAHQNVDVVIMISRAQSILPPDRYAAPWLRLIEREGGVSVNCYG